MKTTTIFTTFLALALTIASCGGGTTTQTTTATQPDSTAKATTSAAQEPEKPAAPLTFNDVAGGYDNDDEGDRISLMSDGTASWVMVGSLNITDFTYTIDGNKIRMKCTDDGTDAGCYTFDPKTRTLTSENGQIYTCFDNPPATTSSQSADTKSPVAAEVAKMLDIDRNEWNVETSRGNLRYEFTADCEGCQGAYTVYCFPLKDDGYMVITEEADIDVLNYKVFTYKGGALKATANTLPVCPVADLLDSQKIQGHAQDVKDLEAIYNRKPQDLIQYWIDPDKQEVRVSLYARFYDQPYWKDAFTDMAKVYTDIPRYHWDGERFVKQQ
ncbi:MAG: hypothetical protein II480_03540 [Bacteroidales bacterium]|nr:hypothetical protein [Bacteroidales bacterium]